MAGVVSVAKYKPMWCRECNSKNVEVTSSQQFRNLRGRPRLHVDVVCVDCGHQWWSVAGVARTAARNADLARVAAARTSGKKTTIPNDQGLSGRVHVLDGVGVEG